MVRLTRAQQQARTRTAVLAAARQEFAEHGYGPAKIDRIAERAELTRGAVYSNFPGKRALYLAVLLDLVEGEALANTEHMPDSPGRALGTFARVWLERLPLADDGTAGTRARLYSLVGTAATDSDRNVLAQTARLEALLLALALEACEPDEAPGRRVRLAELALTMLGGSSLLAELEPGFGDPFDRARAVAHLADLDLADTWAPAHLAHTGPAVPCNEAWRAPEGLVDRLTGAPVDLDADGLVLVLGPGRLAAAEDAVRSASPGDRVTVVLAGQDHEEAGALVRLRIGDLARCLRSTFPARAWGPLRLVLDGGPDLASAMGPIGSGEETEAAVLVRGGAVVARAEGRGAAHAVAARDQAVSPRFRGVER